MITSLVQKCFPVPDGDSDKPGLTKDKSRESFISTEEDNDKEKSKTNIDQSKQRNRGDPIQMIKQQQAKHWIQSNDIL